VASARAKPRIAYVNNWPLSWGFRAVDVIRDAKIRPIPAPAPIKPEQANPAPMYWAAEKIYYFSIFR